MLVEGAPGHGFAACAGSSAGSERSRTRCTSASSSAAGEATRPAPTARGPASPRGAGGPGRRAGHRRAVGPEDRCGAAFSQDLEPDRRRNPVARRVLEQVRPARLSCADRARLPDARPPGAHALRGRGPPRRADDGAGLGAGQHALCARRAFGRPASQRRRPPDRDRARPPRRGKHGSGRRARPGNDARGRSARRHRPGAGEGGGHLLYAGPPEGVALVAGSVTGEFLSGRRKVAVPRARATAPASAAQLKLTGARGTTSRTSTWLFRSGSSAS